MNKKKQADHQIPDYKIIDSCEHLADFAEIINREKVIAVDMEADSMFHFKEKVCLIQIASKKTNVLIDPLKIKDMSHIAPVFANPGIKKIFHGADYDIRSLHRDFGIEVKNLMDTQLICRFLGCRETGLEAVLQKLLNITLDKKYQRKDWSQRPLPDEMLEYAAKDAIYLIPLAKMLEKELKARHRLSWVREECSALSKVRAASNEDEPLFLKFKGAGRLSPRNLAVLESLLQVRRTIAEKKDRPPFKIFSNSAISSIINVKPLTLKQLRADNILSLRQFNMFGAEVVKAVKDGLKTPENHLPVYPRRKAPVMPPKVPERMKRLKVWRDNMADDLVMDPALICNKALMTSIAIKNPLTIKTLKDVEDIKKWQVEAFGKDIINVLKNTKDTGDFNGKQGYI